MFRGRSDLSVHFIGCVYSSFIFWRYPVHFGLWFISVHLVALVYIHPPYGSSLYSSTLWLWFISVRLVASGLYPSTLWLLVYIRPSWTSNSHPLGMIRPLCGLCFISVHVGLQILILLGTICPLCGLVLYPSILDFKFSSSLDDPSTLWTCFISVHVGLQILLLLGRSVHFVDLFFIHPCWTSNSHPFGMTCPLCGLVLYPSTLDFKFSSSWDDPSTLWACSISVHFGLQILILLG